jgi:hypothetical protein
MKTSKWGFSSIAVAAVAFVAGPICARLVHDQTNVCFIPYILLHLAAVVCGIVAAVRGSRWWLLISLCSALLTAQAILGVLVE